MKFSFLFTSNWIKHRNTNIFASRPFHWIRFGCVYGYCVPKALKMRLQKDIITSPSLLWIRGFVLAVWTACVSRRVWRCVCATSTRKLLLPSEFLWTVRLILEPAAFKKDSKALTLIREKWLCSSLWIIIIITIPGFIYPVGL